MEANGNVPRQQNPVVFQHLKYQPVPMANSTTATTQQLVLIESTQYCKFGHKQRFVALVFRLAILSRGPRSVPVGGGMCLWKLSQLLFKHKQTPEAANGVGHGNTNR